MNDQESIGLLSREKHDVRSGQFSNGAYLPNESMTNVADYRRGRLLLAFLPVSRTVTVLVRRLPAASVAITRTWSLPR